MKDRKSASCERCWRQPWARRRRAALGALILAATSFVSCSSRRETPYPARIDEVSGDHQAGLAGARLEDLVVRVMSQRHRDFLGRKGARLPMGGVTVRFEVEGAVGDYDPPAGEDGEPDRSGYPVLEDPNRPAAEGDAPRRLEGVTDTSGQARVRIRLGNRTGDFRIEARVDRPEKKNLKEHFRVVSGVEALPEKTEARVGENVDLELRLTGPGGADDPLEGRVVHFRVVGQPGGPGEGASIRNQRGETLPDGLRTDSTLTVGDRPGTYEVLAEIEAHDGDPQIRGVLFTVRAIDWLVVVVKIAGGALLFLLGVRILANGFLLVLSPHLHLATGALASNRVLGYLGGVLSGVTFQSSSSVTTYLVSFANGGLLTGRGALGILLGVSVGATVLPQVLSLHLDFLVAPLLAIGLICLLLPRRAGRQSWAGVFLGAGLVFASWSLLEAGIGQLALSDAFVANVRPALVGSVDSVAEWPEMARRFGAWLGIGLVGGMLLRTSNLIVVLAVLLAAKGTIDPTTAMPLILGANAGSALNSFLRALFKVREAKRVGAASFVLHLCGLLVFSALSLIPYQGAPLFLWLVEYAAPGVLLHPLSENVEQHVAVAHTVYNLLGSVFFLTFPALLERVTHRIVPSRASSEELKPYRLDENLIEVPSLALRQAVEESAYLTELCRKTIAEAFDSFRYGDMSLSEQVVRRAEVIAGIHRDVGRYLTLVGENQLSRGDASTIEGLQTAAGCLARIGECGEGLRELTARRIEEKLESSEETDRDLSEVYDLVMAQFDNILVLLRRADSRVQDNAIKMVERLAKFRSRLEVGWRQRIEQEAAEDDAAASDAGDQIIVHLQTLIYQQAFDNLFHVASHLAHIAERMRILSPERF